MVEVFPLISLWTQGVGAVSFIIEEKAVKLRHRENQANLLAVMFWISVFQFVTILLYFWADILPGFGYAENIQEFGKKWVLL